MATFDSSYTVYCKGQEKIVDRFFSRVEEAGFAYTDIDVWSGRQHTPPCITVYNEHDNFCFYKDFLPLVYEFDSAEFFFELEEQLNSLDDSIRYGYAIFKNGKCCEEKYNAFDLSDYEDGDDISYDEKQRRLEKCVDALLNKPFSKWEKSSKSKNGPVGATGNAPVG